MLYYILSWLCLQGKKELKQNTDTHTHIHENHRLESLKKNDLEWKNRLYFSKLIENVSFCDRRDITYFFPPMLSLLNVTF